MRWCHGQLQTIIDNEISGRNLPVLLQPEFLSDLFPALGKRIDFKQCLQRLLDTCNGQQAKPQPQSDHDKGDTDTPQKLHDRKYGYLPSTKHADGIFFNKVLDEMYPAIGHLLPDPFSFKERFNMERRRQWENEKLMVGVKKSLAHITSMNPNAAGRVLKASFTAKVTDLGIISDNLAALAKTKDKLSQQHHELREYEMRITNDNGSLKKRLIWSTSAFLRIC